MIALGEACPYTYTLSTSMAFSCCCIWKGREMVSRKVPPALKLLQVQTCKHLSTWATALQRVALPSTEPGRPFLTSRCFYLSRAPILPMLKYFAPVNKATGSMALHIWENLLTSCRVLHGHIQGALQQRVLGPFKAETFALTLKGILL